MIFPHLRILAGESERGVDELWQIGVWEWDGDLAERAAELARGGHTLVRCGRHPAHFTGRVFDLLAVSPTAAGWAGAAAIRCRTALVPGGLSALTRTLTADQLLSYGMGPANTLTLSSMEDGRASVAIQREFTALDGSAIERQELVLPYDGSAPDLFLALTGTALLLGRLRPEGAD